jgi:hypothetical protein
MSRARRTALQATVQNFTVEATDAVIHCAERVCRMIDDDGAIRDTIDASRRVVLRKRIPIVYGEEAVATLATHEISHVSLLAKQPVSKRGLESGVALIRSGHPSGCRDAAGISAADSDASHYAA